MLLVTLKGGVVNGRRRCVVTMQGDLLCFLDLQLLLLLLTTIIVALKLVFGLLEGVILLLLVLLLAW